MEFFTATEKLILRALSTDSRASVTQLAKLAKCSRVTVMKNIKVLEEKLDIKYTLEIDESRLGGSERHIVVMKFLIKPPAEVLYDFFKNDDYAQEVYITKGAFDLFVYVRAVDPVSYIKWETYIAAELSKYRPIFRPSEYTVAQFGFWPLNNSFVNEINKSTKISENDKKILLLLNQNSRMSISEISKAVGRGKGTVRYRLLKLKESGIIKRFTIAVQKPPQSYLIMHFSNYRFNVGINERMLVLRKRYKEADSNGLPLLTTFQIVAPTSGSFRSFGFSLFYNEEDAIEMVPKMHKQIFAKDNIDIKYVRITKVVKGLLPLRNLDIKSNYLPITWTRQKEPT